ncbi:MAG TPA: hypothetical protein VMT03_02505, partial [Polyangia bacterium]|nr:hypothetical protein [Polyangia bacterium]
FFVLQDGLRTQARQVVAAAAQHDAGRLAVVFSELTRTCIACHAVYLQGDKWSIQAARGDAPGPGGLPAR